MDIGKKDKTWFFVFLAAWILLWIFGAVRYSSLLSDYGVANSIQIVVDGSTTCCIEGENIAPETYPVAVSFMYGLLLIICTVGMILFGYRAFFRRRSNPQQGP